MTQVTICKVDEFPVGTKKQFRINAAQVIVYHLEDGFYATQHRCTHTFAPLSRGKIVNGQEIQCPLHRARFDIRTGEVVEWANWPPGVQLLNMARGEKALKTFPVHVENGDVIVEIEI